MSSSGDVHGDHLPQTPNRVGQTGRAIETILLASTACLLAAVAWPIVFDGAPVPTYAGQVAAPAPAAPCQANAPQGSAPTASAPVIQIALLLDTSSSMDGLIDQARTQLWRVVNTLDGATYHGDQPRLEIALYEYGNDSLAGESGWIRRVQPFTSELNDVSEALFSLTTNGGSEHAGQVIGRSIDELEWRAGDGALRVVYIAGNEAFEQGPVRSEQAISRAKQQGVVVNTVFCGSPDEADAAGWREGATASGGRFVSIDPNHVVVHIDAPQDAELTQLGQEINATYIQYGAEGQHGLDNLVEQDNNMAGYGLGGVVERSVSKCSGMYRNDSWDLVDAIDANKLDISEVDRSGLPEPLRGLDDEQLRAHVAAKQALRDDLQQRIATLAKQREAHVAAERARRAQDPDSLDTAIIEAIREQAVAAGFTLDPS
ncbi:hypothetical protein DB30_05258 [Enhygromyxa salina]|uniref:VWFA domain-containing protein n=1 Tax=Enhygromyxa salina TaxID=215803 RepID=A0A0C1ZX91_9BACT|nr:vWA domain-containing protein [Enhygromyxa salina]KIG15688.1 hypothetical protein DB30_05258 [Enhygromyxa salina]